MLANLWEGAWSMGSRAPLFKRWVVRQWYEFFSSLDRDGLVECMNFGYADDTPLVLTLYEETYRYALQMYHHVATQIDVRELDILEVGSGRGGGAAYIMRHLHPRSYTGIDITRSNIAFCQKHYRIPGLKFFYGDAERIDLPDARFDAVINIESSTHYGHIQAFLNEVQRVLVPGGFLLYADTWTPQETVILHQQFAAAGLELLREHDVMPRVVRSIELDDALKVALMEKYTPKFLRGAVKEFASMRGSRKYEAFRRGETQYLCCLVRKPNASAVKIPMSPFQNADAAKPGAPVLA